MIDPAKARVMALSDANEDYTGFYELIWEFNSKYPAASEAERLNAARSTLADLFNEGLVELFAARWSPPTYEPVVAGGADVIADAASWRAPSETPGGRFFAFAATEAGERVYHDLSAEDFANL